MNILIVEDDHNKLKQLVELVRNEMPAASIAERRSYQSGLQHIVQSKPALVILDMSMPTFDVTPVEQGGRTRPYAGREILSEVVRRKLPVKVIVVTQFESFHDVDGIMTLEQLRQSLSEKFASKYVKTIYYNAAESGWRVELARAIAEAVPQGGEE